MRFVPKVTTGLPPHHPPRATPQVNIAGEDDDDDCGHDETVCDMFDDHLTYD
jgi:hypothetical protein